jgi:hypothetical protein
MTIDAVVDVSAKHSRSCWARDFIFFCLSVLCFFPLMCLIGVMVAMLDWFVIHPFFILLAAACAAVMVSEMLRRRISEADYLREGIALLSALLIGSAFVVLLSNLFGMHADDSLFWGPVMALVVAVALRSYSALVLASVGSFFLLLVLHYLAPLLLLSLALLAPALKRSELAVILLAVAGLQIAVLSGPWLVLTLAIIGCFYSGAAAASNNDDPTHALSGLGATFLAIPAFELSSMNAPNVLWAGMRSWENASLITWLLPALMFLAAIVLWVHSVRKWIVTRHVPFLAVGTLIASIAFLPGLATGNDNVMTASTNLAFASLAFGLLTEGIRRQARHLYWTGWGALSLLFISRAFEYEYMVWGVLGCLALAIVAVLPKWTFRHQSGLTS